MEKSKSIMKKLQWQILNLIEIATGSLVMALSVSLFLLPNQLSTGGFTGIGTITYYLFNISIGTTTIILNIPLFVIAFLKLGKGFVIRGIIGTILLSTFLNLTENIEPLTNDRFLSCIYGGILMGLGTAIILRADSSTGGTELLTGIITKYKPGIRLSNLMIIVDIIIVGLNMIFFKEIEIGLYSAIAIYLMGKIIDILFEGIYFTKMMFIISDKYQEITEKIHENVMRGTTGLYARGMYTKKDKMVILCVTSRNEVIKIRQIIKPIDPRAFIIISNAREVFGRGFKS